MKKGDRVRVIPNKKDTDIGEYYNIGNTGTIIDIQKNGWIDVKFDDGSLNTACNLLAYKESLELVNREEKK